MTNTAAIIGGGVIGGAWAARFLLNGWNVKISDPDPESERKRIKRYQDTKVRARIGKAGPYYLDLIEAEIGSQSTELVLELEWGELTDQISSTVTDVKALLWGEIDQSEEILEVGLTEASPRDQYNDLLVK